MNIVDKILVDPITRGLKFFTKGGVVVSLSPATTRSYNSAGNNLTTSVFSDVAQISLEPGDWDLSAVAVFGQLTALTGTRILAFVGTVAGDNFNGYNSGDNTVLDLPTMPTVAANCSGSLSGYRVNPTVTTIYYLKARGLFSAGTMNCTGRISARLVQRYKE